MSSVDFHVETEYDVSIRTENNEFVNLDSGAYEANTYHSPFAHTTKPLNPPIDPCSNESVVSSPMDTASTPARSRLLPVLLSLICGIFIAGRLHFKHWAHEIDQYRAGTEDDALVSIIYETVYLLLRIFVGGYGSYAVFRDLIVPVFRQQTGESDGGQTQAKQ